MKRMISDFKIVLGSCFLSALTLGSVVESVAAQPNVSEFKRFADWCDRKESLTPAARHTVEVLLEEAGTQECEKADETLTNLTALYLGGNQIADVQPLSALTNLTALNLGSNQIADVQPLSALTNLTALNLGSNPLPDRTCPVHSAISICQF